MNEFGLLGRSLSYSCSPEIHRLLGVPGYRCIEIEPEEVDNFLLNGFWRGLNVTIPYKKTAAARCTWLSPLARQTGSVNTLLRLPDGGAAGYNTDCGGFSLLLSSFPLQGKKALILGSGGAAAAVRAVLENRGAQIVTVSRSGPDHYGNLERHRDAALLVNATPVGTWPDTDAAPLDLRRLPGLELVLDLIYNPLRSRLLLQARSLGIPGHGGLLMLAEQARLSAQLFLEKPIPAARTQDIFRCLFQQRCSLILIGMPGCGKTTLGRLLAQALGRPFADTDELLAARYRQPAGVLLAAVGEQRFRQMESEVLSQVCRESGLVIATGGGVVERPENEFFLRQNGLIFWVHRDPELLALEGRPLSLAESPASILARRTDAYRRFSDMTADNNGSIDDTMRQILRKWREAMCIF